MSKERTSVVSDAYRYIGTLQRQLEELKAQVPEEAYSARTHPKDYESREMLDQRNCSRQQCESLERCPMVSVDCLSLVSIRLLLHNVLMH